MYCKSIKICNFKKNYLSNVNKVFMLNFFIKAKKKPLFVITILFGIAFLLSLFYLKLSNKNINLGKEGFFIFVNVISVILLAIFLAYFLCIKIKKRKLSENLKYWLNISFYSILAALLIFYGLLLITLIISTYITFLLFVILIGFIVWFLVKYLIKKLPIKPKFAMVIKAIFIAFFVIWFVSENYLRYNDINKTYNEIITGFYISGYTKPPVSNKSFPSLRINRENDVYVPYREEFAYEISSNSEGLRDNDYPVKKDCNELRLICFGNSFTEGIGAPNDSTWPKLLENKLNNLLSKKVSVFNAGISGSDPFFYFKLLEEKMLKYNPDLVLLTLASTDFEFYIYRGGFERFNENGYQYRKGPAWERLYAVSFVFRYYINNILNYKNLFSEKVKKNNMLEAEKALEDCVTRFNKLGIEKGYQLIVVFMDDKTISPYSNIMDNMSLQDSLLYFDLYKYNKEIENISHEMKRAYHWPIDGHYNSKGYDLCARGVLWHLKKHGIIDTIK